MSEFEFSLLISSFYDRIEDKYYLAGVLSFSFPRLTFELDSAHLEWIAQAWGFECPTRLPELPDYDDDYNCYR